MQEFNYLFRVGLERGLRKSERNKRGEQALVQSAGAVPIEGALEVLETVEEIDISSISPPPAFPFPQIFVLNSVTIVCTQTAIYERDDDSGALTLKLSSLTEGVPWTVADFHRFIVLSNGYQYVFRDGETLEWHTNNTFGVPIGSSICNFNGQAIITAPGETIPIGLGAPMLDFSDEDNSQYLGLL